MKSKSKGKGPQPAHRAGPRPGQHSMPNHSQSDVKIVQVEDDDEDDNKHASKAQSHHDQGGIRLNGQAAQQSQFKTPNPFMALEYLLSEAEKAGDNDDNEEEEADEDQVEEEAKKEDVKDAGSADSLQKLSTQLARVQLENEQMKAEIEKLNLWGRRNNYFYYKHVKPYLKGESDRIPGVPGPTGPNGAAGGGGAGTPRARRRAPGLPAIPDLRVSRFDGQKSTFNIWRLQVEEACRLLRADGYTESELATAIFLHIDFKSQSRLGLGMLATSVNPEERTVAWVFGILEEEFGDDDSWLHRNIAVRDGQVSEDGRGESEDLPLPVAVPVFGRRGEKGDGEAGERKRRPRKPRSARRNEAQRSFFPEGMYIF